jgi:choline dehydrogenase
MSPAQQVILEKAGDAFRASGVVYTDSSSGQTLNATAKKEVILSSGAFKTPQLLMLSVWPPKGNESFLALTMSGNRSC